MSTWWYLPCGECSKEVEAITFTAGAFCGGKSPSASILVVSANGTVNQRPVAENREELGLTRCWQQVTNREGIMDRSSLSIDSGPQSDLDPLDIARAAIREALAGAADVNLDDIQPLPESAGWALAPDALRFLVSLVRHYGPRHIVEFGSGLSTRVLAWACAVSELRCRITSIDHDPEFIGHTAVELASQNIKVPVASVLAPLVARTFDGQPMPVYYVQPRQFASGRRADLVIVDGPPRALGGREGTLHQTMGFARPGTILLLDDASRVEERRVLSQWQSTFDDAIEVTYLPGFVRGLAAVVIREPMSAEAAFGMRLGLLVRDLEVAIEPRSLVILVDEEQFEKSLFTICRIVPFLERDGQYWGPPADDDTAIQELERLRKTGATHIAFGWPAFWWLDFYSGLHQHVRRSYPCILENHRLIVFDLQNAV